MRRRGSITDGAAERWQRQRFNPWRDMTPEKLVSAFAEWDQGWLRRAALMWENRAESDEVLAGAVPKRCASVSRLPWAVLPVDDSPRAAQHVVALEEFYDRHITATDALDLDQRGGMRLLIEMMMDAVFTGKAVHEIIWRPGRLDVGAELRSVPLYFFEQLSGRLRYTGPEMTTQGEDLEPTGWMVTARRRRLMKAAMMCCLFKSMSMSDWISYSGRFGQPGVHGETDATPGSEEWAQAEEAVAAYAAEFAALTRSGVKFNLIETGKNPNAPYEPMVERMTRILTMLCRGADLGTLSSKDGAGASLQQDESDLLLEDDAQMVSEALQHSLSRPVIRYLFGEDPMAYIEIQVPSDSDTAKEIEVDTALLGWGVRQSPEDLAERYGRTIAEAATPVTDVAAAENDATPAAAAEDAEALGSLSAVLRHAISDEARTRLYVAIRDALVWDDRSPGTLVEKLEAIRVRLPEWLGENPEAEMAFARFSAAATLAGWSEAGGRPVTAVQTRANRRGGKISVTGAENDKGRSEAITRQNIKDAEISPMGRFFAWLENAGTSEGARKGWETRRRNGWKPVNRPKGTGKPGKRTQVADVEAVLDEAFLSTDSRVWAKHSDIDQQAAAEIRMRTKDTGNEAPDLSGWERIVEADKVNKILPDHIEDDFPVEEEDFRRLRDLLDRPESQTWEKGKRGSVLRSVVRDGRKLIIVEEAYTGRKQLTLLSLHRP